MIEESKKTTSIPAIIVFFVIAIIAYIIFSDLKLHSNIVKTEGIVNKNTQDIVVQNSLITALQKSQGDIKGYIQDKETEKQNQILNNQIKEQNSLILMLQKDQEEIKVKLASAEKLLQQILDSSDYASLNKNNLECKNIGTPSSREEIEKAIAQYLRVTSICKELGGSIMHSKHTILMHVVQTCNILTLRI